jgi:Domain of unknown function (DUF1857)
MRFEHLIEINAPQASVQLAVPAFTLEQLWRGLMLRVTAPGRFPMGPDACECHEVKPGQFQRTIVFGQHVMKDAVVCEPMQRISFTPEPHGDTAPIALSLQIEEPAPGHVLLRFVYESLRELTSEEAYFNEYRHSAWLHNDRDMVRTLRQWLTDGDL